MGLIVLAGLGIAGVLALWVSLNGPKKHWEDRGKKSNGMIPCTRCGTPTNFLSCGVCQDCEPKGEH